MEIAEVEVVRSGGFAAVRRRKRTEGDALGAAERQALAELVRGGTPPPAPGADRFTYSVILRLKDGAERRVELPETAVPPALRGLLP